MEILAFLLVFVAGFVTGFFVAKPKPVVRPPEDRTTDEQQAAAFAAYKAMKQTRSGS